MNRLRIRRIVLGCPRSSDLRAWRALVRAVEAMPASAPPPALAPTPRRQLQIDLRTVPSAMEQRASQWGASRG